MSNIIVRTLTGSVFITVVLFPLFWNDLAAVIVFSIFHLLGIVEYIHLFKNSDRYSLPWRSTLLMSITTFTMSAFVLLKLLDPIFLLILFPLTMFVSVQEIWRRKEQPLMNMALSHFGLLYVTIPFILMAVYQVWDSSSFPKLAGMFIIIWMNDTFAYLSGRFFGKTKLIERISPNKTWEGTIGGIIFSVLAGIAIGLIFDQNSIAFWAISGLIIAPCAIVGDLLESVMKRNVGVKDTGNLLPGHGGILDRFDATLFTIPFFMVWTYFYLYF